MEETPRKRCKRYNIPLGVHELTFSCQKRMALLSRDRTRGYTLDAIERTRQVYGFHLWAYVIMPEHVHLLIWFPSESYSVGRVLKSLKQSVARRAIRYLRTERPDGLALLTTGRRHHPYRFWLDGGGYDRNITSMGALRNSFGYIHNNPVKRELALGPEDWPWSSAKAWTSGTDDPIAIDRDSFPER